jgi:hypothetical protein
LIAMWQNLLQAKSAWAVFKTKWQTNRQTDC